MMMKACSAGIVYCALSTGLTHALPCFATLPTFNKQRFELRLLHEQEVDITYVRQFMREHIQPKHIIHLMHDEKNED